MSWPVRPAVGALATALYHCNPNPSHGTQGREDVLLQIFLVFFLLLAQGLELLLKHDAVSLYFAQLAVGESGVVCRRTLRATAQHVTIMDRRDTNP